MIRRWVDIWHRPSLLGQAPCIPFSQSSLGIGLRNERGKGTKGNKKLVWGGSDMGRVVAALFPLKKQHAPFKNWTAFLSYSIFTEDSCAPCSLCVFKVLLPTLFAFCSLAAQNPETPSLSDGLITNSHSTSIKTEMLVEMSDKTKRYGCASGICGQ